MRIVTICLLALLLFSMPVSAKIVGEITDAGGKAIKDATVSVLDLAGNVVTSSAADKKGKFELDVPAGEYVFLVEAEGYGPFRRTATVVDGEQIEAAVQLVDVATWKQNQLPRLFNAGVEALQNGDFETAKAKFAEIEEVDPSFPPLPRVKAAIAHGEKDWEAAAQAVDQMVMAEGTLDPQLAPMAVEVYVWVGDREKATRALALVPAGQRGAINTIDFYNEAIRLVSEDEDPDASLAMFDNIIFIDPENVGALQGMAAIEFNREAYTEALVWLDALLVANPGHAAGLRMRFYSLLELEDDGMVEALEAWAPKATPSEIAVVLELASEAFVGGAPDVALAFDQAVVAGRPQEARAHYQLGLVLASMGRAADAKMHLQHFVDMAPEDADAAAAKAMIADL